MPVRASRTISPTRVLAAERLMTGSIGDGSVIGWNARVSSHEYVSTVRPAARIIGVVR